MIKREKKTKLRGSVLLTVVCVMSLLIVLLFGTLTLATAANNRAHVNYSTAQTGVTSRTVVDAAIKAMEVNENFGNAVAALKYGESNTPLEVNVDLSNLPDSGRYGHVAPVTIEAVGKKKFYDVSKQQWLDGDIIKFTSTVSMAGVDSTTSSYIVKQPPSKKRNDKGGGAGFVTVSGSNITCQTNLYGGAYINLPRLGENNDGVDGYQPGSGDNADVSGAIFYDYSYNEESGAVRNYANWGTDKSIYRQFAAYNKDDSSTYFKLGTDGGADAEADIYVNNNMDVQEWKKIIFPSEGKGITVWGDLYFRIQASKLEYINKANSTEIDFNKIPYIYVDGTIKGEAIYLGNGKPSNNPLNVFCGNIVADNLGTVHIDGDLFCMNPNNKSVIKPMNSTSLYSWTGSVINKVDSATQAHTANSIYCKGDLELENVNIDGDVRVEGTCTIGKNVTIRGDLVAKVLLEGNEAPDVWGNIYCGNLADVLKSKDVLWGYRKLPIITHPEQKGVLNPEIKDVVQNEKRYYYSYSCQWSPEGPRDPYGNLTDNNWQIYYKWNENINPSDFDIDYNNFESVQPYLDLSGYMKDNERPEAISGVDGDRSYYYVETEIISYDEAGNPITSSNSRRVDYKEYGLKEDGTRVYNRDEIYKDIPAYKTIPNMDGSDSGIKLGSENDIRVDKDNDSYIYYKTSSGEVVSEATATAEKKKLEEKVKNIDEYISDIYPKYAERYVILGLEEIPGIEKDETQVVKTMEEVLRNVANPYEKGKLSDELSAKYDSLKEDFKDTAKRTKIYFDDYSNITNVFEKYANVNDNGLYTVVNSKPSGKLQQNQGAIINKDCILNVGGLRAAENGGYLIFEPGTSDMLVVVNKLELENMKIIVNDSEGGTVNFFIENGNGSSGVMKLSSSTNWVAPTSYLKAFNDSTSDVMSYGGGGGLDLESLGRPKINIYGAPGTELISTESGGFIANIISADLKFKSSAGTKMPVANKFKKIYYNGKEIDGSEKPFVMGCVNTKFADIPNTLNVIYIDDKEEGGGGGGSGDSAFNYRVLYCDEY